LLEGEEKYRELIESISDIFFAMDKDLRCTHWNKASEKLTGISAKDAIGKSLTEIFPDVKGTGIEQFYLGILRTRKPQSFVNKYHLGGKDFVFEINAYPTKDGISVFVKDVTERKKIEEALTKSEEKWRSLVENAPNVILIASHDGEIQFINRTVIDATSEEVVGKSIYDFIDPENHDLVRKTIEHVFQTEKGSSYEIRGTGTKGKVSWYFTQVGPIKHDGHVVSVTLITTDVTERKEMQEKLRQHSDHLEELVQKRTRELLEFEKRYSVVVEEANDGVFIFQEKKVVFVNRRGAEILGYSKDELTGLHIEALLDEKCRQLAMDRYERRMRGEKVPETYEVEVKPKTGESIHVEISATRIDYQGQPADLIIIRDIEERKRMEEERIQLERLIAIGEMATIVAHDIRNPLTSITNASFYIKKTCLNHTDAECKTAIKMLDIIQRETIYASNIINDLLDFASKSLPEKIEQNINELVQASLTASNIPKNIKIITNFAEKSVVSVDEKQLKRVFFNLIKNAVQSMSNGGKLTITTIETKDKIIITFTDTGQGISETDMANIFKPFFTTKSKGMGLGLPICKNIVERHGGIIDFESKVGQGTTFIINLPKF
jgi:PAS domain S-box-containing protein